MAHWLLKSEPETWSWDDQVAAGEGGTAWDGVRNHLARRHLAEMQPGEEAFFYHSGRERAILGVVEVIGSDHSDPSDASGRFGLVTVRAVAALPAPVTLQAIRREPRLAGMALVTLSRLSVQPVRPEEWRIVRAMGGLDG